MAVKQEGLIFDKQCSFIYENNIMMRKDRNEIYAGMICHAPRN